MKLSLKKSAKPQPRKPKRLADICLLVYNNALLHAEQQDLVAQPDESLLTLTPAELAAAARRLLPNTTLESHIALALPATEFVATPLTLPGIDAKNLQSAVMLQLPTLLPGITQPLSLAIQPQADSAQPTVGLWMARQRADDLFTAFAHEGLFLAYILPRPLLSLAAEQCDTPCCIIDEDQHSATCVLWSGSAISQWLHVAKADWEAHEFATQWQQALQSLQHPDSECPQQHKTSVSDWEHLTMPTQMAYDYGFVPDGAVQQVKKIAQQRRQYYWRLAASVGGLALLVALSGVFYYQHDLKQQLRELQGQTKSVSELNREVVAMENYIAPVEEFPRHQVVQLLNRLNQIIPKQSWLTELNIEVGKVEVRGYSPDAGVLLQTLTAEPEFLEVEFSQERQNQQQRNVQRFGITFRLAEVDVVGYWEQHFPAQE